MCLIGNIGVGKLAIFNKFFKNDFYHAEKTNFINDMGVKRVTINEEEIKLVVIPVYHSWGKDPYDLAPRSFPYSSGCILVYDITNRQSFEDIGKWLSLIKKYLETNDQSKGKMDVVLVGNKKDLEGDRAVKEGEANKYLDDNNVREILEVSAKTGENVENAFLSLAHLLLSST